MRSWFARANIGTEHDQSRRRLDDPGPRTEQEVSNPGGNCEATQSSSMYQHRQRTNPLVPHPSTDAPHPRQTTEYVEPELHGSYEHTSSLGEASRDLSWPVELIRQPPISTSVPVVVQDAIKNYKPPPGFQLVIPKA
ncbi:hypothetical protein F443_21302, partial [Phytophthora nicotianae P1569]